jgi:glutathione S-transferase
MTGTVAPETDLPVLYHNDMSVCAAKVRMAFAEKQVAFHGIHLDIRAGDAQRPEYVKLNPNQVVPTLVWQGRVVIESNVICEFIDDAWPTHGSGSLRPADALDRAQMRLWMKRLDDGMHAMTGVVSTCVAFRHQHLARAPEDLQAWLNQMVDHARRERLASCIHEGLESPYFTTAVRQFDALMGQFETTLTHAQWLAGDRFSLADIAYAPYLARLAHLGLDDMVQSRPGVRDWSERVLSRPGFRTGIADWFNPKYLAIFDRERDRARARAATILG